MEKKILLKEKNTLNKSKIGFLFAGQGAQYVGMGKELENSLVFKEVFEHLPKDLQKICYEGPVELLNNTLNAQPSIVAVSLGIARVLKTYGVDCEYVAGLSLGEYTALAYSNVLSTEDVLNIVVKRSEIMSKAVPKDTAMAAVFNCEVKIVEEVVSNFKNLEIANYNSPKQIVITGKLNSLNEATLKFNNLGIKTKKLNVSGAFHSSYLKSASDEFFTVLNNFKFKNADKKIVFNTLGTVSEKDVKSILRDQMCSSVKFMQSVEFMIAEDVDTFIEIGPGKVLSGLVRQINSDVNIYQVDSLNSIRKVANILNE